MNQTQNHTRANRTISGFANRDKKGRFDGRIESQCKQNLITIIAKGDVTLQGIVSELNNVWCKRTIQMHLRELRTNGVVKAVAVNGQRKPIYRMVKP